MERVSSSSSSSEEDDQWLLLDKLDEFRKALEVAQTSEDWNKLALHAKCTWVNMDPTDAHFHSHVDYSRREDGKEVQIGATHPLIQALKLPSKVILLRENAKRRFKWYKKRECERRRRYRLLRNEYDARRKRFTDKRDKITMEDLEMMKFYALSILDRCEFCGGFFLSVNLFWGATLCDNCYFNPTNICSIMKRDEGKVMSFQSDTTVSLMGPSHCFESSPPSAATTVPPPPPTSPSSVEYPFVSSAPSASLVGFTPEEILARNTKEDIEDSLFAKFSFLSQQGVDNYAASNLSNLFRNAESSLFSNQQDSSFYFPGDDAAMQYAAPRFPSNVSEGAPVSFAPGPDVAGKPPSPVVFE